MTGLQQHLVARLGAAQCCGRGTRACCSALHCDIVILCGRRMLRYVIVCTLALRKITDWSAMPLPVHSCSMRKSRVQNQQTLPLYVSRAADLKTCSNCCRAS